MSFFYFSPQPSAFSLEVLHLLHNAELMNILALDTSTAWLSVAIGAELDSAPWLLRERIAEGSASGEILPMISAALNEVGIKLNDLNGIAVGIGPGSFTGVRIACGVAQGLALGANLLVAGVSGLEAMAEEARVKFGAKRVVAALDARMKEIYAAAWEWNDASGVWNAAVPIGVAPAAKWAERFAAFGEDWMAVGDVAEVWQAMPMRAMRPSAEFIGRLAVSKFQCGETLAPAEVLPLYIRNHVALTIAERAAGAALSCQD
jgi:tRNA threonylcarbamoyladenosine biosynthesis protein TsaB